MKDPKSVALVCFYDSICLSIRALSAMIKRAGHEVHLIFMKHDRVSPIEGLKEDSVQVQILWLDKLWGCGLDVNPITDIEWDLLQKLIADIKPDVIGTSSRSIHADLANETVRVLRGVAPQSKYLAGGYGPTMEPKTYLQGHDYVCIGEGDYCIVPFIEAENLSSVPNIAYMKNGEVVFNEILPPAKLDDLPYSDFDSLNKYMVEDNTVQTGHSFYDRQTYDIFASRGCPSSCTYCMVCQWGRLIGKYGRRFPKIRLRSPASVIDELKAAKINFDIKLARFRDGIFGLSEEWFFEFMDLYDKENLGINFHGLLDERYATENIIKRLYETGLRTTTVGIQSGHEGLRRKYLNRPISDDRIVDYAEMLVRNGIRIKYDLLGWNPFENEETLTEGLNFLKRLPKSYEIATYQLKMYPGSPIFDLYEREKPTSLSLDDYSFWAIICEMVLFSKETEEQALDLCRKGPPNFDETLNIWQQAIKKVFGKRKLYAVADIEKGQKITGLHLGLEDSDEDGVTGSYRYDITGLTVKNFVPKHSIIKWEDLDYSYQQLRAR